MKTHKLFDFMEDSRYKLMVDMSKEIHTESEISSIIKRFKMINIDEFFTICHEHELDGVVGVYASSLELTLSDEWLNELNRQKIRLEYLRNTAIDICRIMDDNGIPMVVLKNGGIMIDMIGESVKCPMEDIDTLVEKQDFYKAHKILVDNGFVFKFRSDYETEQLNRSFLDGSSEYFIPTPQGERVWLELSWRTIAGRWIRPDLEPDTIGYIDRSYLSKNLKVHILSPEDNLLQVCIHTAKHSYVRAPGLRLHMDVDRILAHKKIDWDLFMQNVARAKVKKATYLSLYIPSVLFETKVPQKVLDELCPKNIDGLLTSLASAGLLHPKSSKFGKLKFLKFQTSLYDNYSDIFHVIYPSKAWMKERYATEKSLQIFKFTILRVFDLVGFRKRK